MSDQIENCGDNNTLLSLNISTIEEEDDFVDNKIHVSETVIVVNNVEVQDNVIRYDDIEEYEATTIVDNIKAELESSEGQYNISNDNVKIEEGISCSDIKIEFDNRLLYCEHCRAYYEDYCIKCGMLVHILNRNASDNSDNKTREELPNNILEIQHYLFGQFRILALKVIPDGVKFGPFTGLCRTECAWRIKGGKFVVDKDRSKYLNWMQYIKTARNINERNLVVLQCEDYLYYQSTRQILPGEELLVYFGEEFDEGLNENVEVDFIPTTEHMSKDVFACTFCCLGFSSKSYLVEHKQNCLGDAGSDFSFKELMQCPYCKIHFGQKEYLEYHFACYSERNDRKCSAPTIGYRMTAVDGRRTRRSPLYKCEQCKYRTNYKADLKQHTNSQHYKKKNCKCGVCYRRFETKGYLRLHVENTHASVGEEEDSAHSRCHYLNTYIKVKQSNSQGKRKGFKCSLCGLRLKHKRSLTSHMKAKHLKKFNFHCDSCEYRTNHKRSLECHIKRKHSKEFNFNCDLCEYRTNWKFDLKFHIKTKHLKEFNFNCDSCEYRTNRKCNLEKHIKTKHLNEFNFNCDSCEYRTNSKQNLQLHIKTKHLKEFNFNCDSCEYRTNRKCNLEDHIKTKHLKECNFNCNSSEYGTNQKYNLELPIKTEHLKEFNFNCGSCEYRTNWKHSLVRHKKTKHLKESNFNCDSCEYRTNLKYDLERHIKTKHLKEFNFKCDSCEYRTNYKPHLERHVKTKHLKEFNFNCDSCEYRTNWKHSLERHIKTKHLKESNFNCDSCEYRTNQKYNLEDHIKTKHLKEFNFNCDLCEYRTNRKGVLKAHIKAKHLKDFDVKYLM